MISLSACPFRPYGERGRFRACLAVNQFYLAIKYLLKFFSIKRYEYNCGASRGGSRNALEKINKINFLLIKRFVFITVFFSAHFERILYKCIKVEFPRQP